MGVGLGVLGLLVQGLDSFVNVGIRGRSLEARAWGRSRLCWAVLEIGWQSIVLIILNESCSSQSPVTVKMGESCYSSQRVSKHHAVWDSGFRRDLGI